MIARMSRKGDCYDNAVAESFFSNLKNEMSWHRDFARRAEALRRGPLSSITSRRFTTASALTSHSTMSARCNMKSKQLFLNQLSVKPGLAQTA